MFTGIIEHLGTIESLDVNPGGGRISIHAPAIAPALAISNSIAVNGCCLTVVTLDKKTFAADLSGETVLKTSFGARQDALKKGSSVNLEQPLTAGKELGGHLVLGHVDGTGLVSRLEAESHDSGSWRYCIEVPSDFSRYIVPKGSITIDGISLTVAGWNPSTRIVEIAVIPFTHEHTNIRDRKPGDAVNLEADILGKYIERYLAAHDLTAGKSSGTAVDAKPLTIESLASEGF